LVEVTRKGTRDLALAAAQIKEPIRPAANAMSRNPEIPKIADLMSHACCRQRLSNIHPDE